METFNFNFSIIADTCIREDFLKSAVLLELEKSKFPFLSLGSPNLLSSVRGTHWPFQNANGKKRQNIFWAQKLIMSWKTFLVIPNLAVPDGVIVGPVDLKKQGKMVYFQQLFFKWKINIQGKWFVFKRFNSILFYCGVPHSQDVQLRGHHRDITAKLLFIHLVASLS